MDEGAARQGSGLLEIHTRVSTTKIKKKIIQNSYAIIYSELSREIQHMENWKQKQKP